jgi:hypothetical protein
LPVPLAAGREAASKRLLISVDVAVLPAALFAREVLAAVEADVFAYVKVSSVDVTLQVKLHIIALGTVRIEAGELVCIHFNLTFW